MRVHLVNLCAKQTGRPSIEQIWFKSLEKKEEIIREIVTNLDLVEFADAAGHSKLVFAATFPVDIAVLLTIQTF